MQKKIKNVKEKSEMKLALISVSDKSGLVEIAQKLKDTGYTLLASSGTVKHLENAGIDVIKIEEYINFPHILNGRVKSLHPAIYAGILARDSSDDEDELKKFNLNKIDIVICNLYPFENILERSNATKDELIENIDIGGVSLLRAAAKNYKRVLVLSSPEQYKEAIEYLESEDCPQIELRHANAIKALSLCAKYDVAIANWMEEVYKENYNKSLLNEKELSLQNEGQLRYGENPHQKAWSYFIKNSKNEGVLSGKLLQGKELSYNNILDCDVAYRTVLAFSLPTFATVKHQTLTSVSSVEDQSNAFLALRSSIRADSVSIYGGIIAYNGQFDKKCCEEIKGIFLECIIASSFSDEAKLVLSKRKNCRIIQAPFSLLQKEGEIKSIVGGILLQEIDIIEERKEDFECVTKRNLSSEELKIAFFGWKAAQMVKSNAIVLARKIDECSGYYTCGIGGGQPNRVDAAKDAIRRANLFVKGSILVSDGFIPFTDTIEEACKNGINIIVEPGGSIKDDECIKYCNDHNLTLIFTHRRHFKH